MPITSTQTPVTSTQMPMKGRACTGPVCDHSRHNDAPTVRKCAPVCMMASRVKQMHACLAQIVNMQALMVDLQAWLVNSHLLGHEGGLALRCMLLHKLVTPPQLLHLSTIYIYIFINISGLRGWHSESITVQTMRKAYSSHSSAAPKAGGGRGGAWLQRY
eukprot:6394472-Pyramimonas_sp.AAC.1